MSVQVIIKRKFAMNDPEKLMPLLTQLRDIAKTQPGYLASETLRSLDHPDDYLVVSKWNSAADWENWFRSEERRGIQGQIDSIIGERTFYEVFEPIMHT